MGFLDKMRFISDEVYNIRNTWLFKMGKIYKCYIIKEESIRELIIGNKYSDIHRINNLSIVLTDETKYCLIDVYSERVIEYYTGIYLEKSVYNEYIHRNINKGLLADLLKYRQMGNEDINIEEKNDCLYIRLKFYYMDIRCIYSKSVKKWLVSPLEDAYIMQEYNKDLQIVVCNNKRTRIIYKGQVLGYHCLGIPEYINYRGTEYLRCRLKCEHSDIIFKLGDRCIEHIKSNNIIKTYKEGQIIVYGKDDECNLIDLDTKDIIRHNICIISNHLCKDKSIMSYRDESNKRIIFFNTKYGNYTLGNLLNIDIIGSIDSRLVIIDDDKRDILLIDKDKVYRLNKQFNEEEAIKLLSLDTDIELKRDLQLIEPDF